MEATGLDGWAHGSPSEVPVSSNKWMAENNRFCIVTATLGEAMSGLRVKDEDGKKLMLNESLIVDVWGEDTVNEFYSVYPRIRRNYYDGPEAFYQQNGFGDLSRFRAKFLENIKNAHDAGVLLAGGSDCVYPSLWDGEVMHRELELFVMAGIEPVQAIKCCTHNAATILRREKEFGSLQEGHVRRSGCRRRQPGEEYLRHTQRQARLPAWQASGSQLAETEEVTRSEVHPNPQAKRHFNVSFGSV